MTLVKLNTARNCLRYIIRTYSIKELYMPYYICPALKSAVRKEKCKINFYHIDETFTPVQEFQFNDYVLYPNYFGICTNNVRNLAAKYKNLIVDNAHAFYNEFLGLASFNSLRKFFQTPYGIMNGAYLHIEKLMYEHIDEAEPYIIDNEITYEKIVKNENILDEEKIKYISKTSEKTMNSIIFEQDKILRLSKFNELHNRYRQKNELNINLENGEIPFVYPYFTHDENIGYELERQGMMIYRYWEGLSVNFDEYKFYKYLIPIPLINVNK